MNNYQKLYLFTCLLIVLLIIITYNNDSKYEASYLITNNSTANLSANVIEVYDGDTFYINIKNVHPVFGKRIGVRINGIDCPEIRTSNASEKEQALLAKEYLSSLILHHSVVLSNVKRDKYFRILADVYIDDINIKDKLLEKGYAREYNGGTKEDW